MGQRGIVACDNDRVRQAFESCVAAVCHPSWTHRQPQDPTPHFNVSSTPTVADLNGDCVGTVLRRRRGGRRGDDDRQLAPGGRETVELVELIDAVERALQPRPRAVMRGFSLAGWLQLVDLDRKSTTVAARSGETVGRTFVSEGEVVDASLGTDFGRVAFFEIMGLPTPLLELAPLPSQVHRCITGPLNQFLVDALGAGQDEPSGPAPEDGDGWGEVGESTGLDVAASRGADGSAPKRSECS